jgi:DNA adenine methylase
MPRCDEPDERRPVQKSFSFGDESKTAASEAPVPANTIVHRIRPPVKAHGGKYYLARRIVPILLGVRERITEYLEPCAFGGSVFLAMPRFQREILGDINPDVVALWTVLSDAQAGGELSARLGKVSYDRPTFEAAKQAGGGTLIEQATRFLIRCRFSRGGLGRDYAWSERQRGGRPGDENAWETFRDNELPKIVARARGAEVTADPCWWTAWESREKIHRLIYADPPYMPKTRAARNAYGAYEMTPLQHFWLVAALRAHSGPAAISGYRCEEYDRWLHGWRRFDFDMPNNAGQTRRKQRRTESLWINW